MDLLNYQYYPLGFRTPLAPEQARHDTDVDHAWVALYETIRNGRNNIASMSFRIAVLKHAKRLLGTDFRTFLDAQDRNPKLTRSGFVLLEETCRFIQTGHRQLNLSSNQLLLAEEFRAQRFESPEGPQRTTKLSEKFNVSAPYLYQWVNQPNGMADLICTLNVLFGSTVE
jgi:hypothetical protein